MKSVFLFAIIGLAGATVLPTQSLAGHFNQGGAMLPFLLEYELCAYSAASPSADAVRTRCSSKRKEIDTKTGAILARFFPSDLLEAKQHLQLALTAIEKEAAHAGRKNEVYGPDVQRYTRCLIETSFADREYLNGIMLNGAPIAKKCRSLYDEGLQNTREKAERRNDLQRLRHLNSMFRSLRAAPRSDLLQAPPPVF